MAHDPQVVRIEPGTWGPDADRLIALAHQHASTAAIRYQVEHQGARLFYVKAYGGITQEWHIVAAFVLRIDHTADGPEGVIVSGAGQVAGVDMLETCMPEIEKLFSGVRAIRYHTARPGLARRLAAHGYEAAEIVCRKEIKHENELQPA